MDLLRFLAVGFVRASAELEGSFGGTYLSDLYVERGRGSILEEKCRNGDGKSTLHFADDSLTLGG
jgi:hypothetical protein